MAGTDGQAGGPWSHLPGTPIASGLAVVLGVALLALIALRHFFGNIRVEAGTR
jgi:UDP-N-acetylmuramyl pentapeptide phosphotransferase/UDP-N-acetylglucosamine-1-phosphate transferase